MADTIVTCPSCGTSFPLDQLLRKDLEASIRGQLEAEAEARELKLSQREQSISKKEHELQKELDAVELRIVEEVKKKESIIKEHIQKSLEDQNKVQIAELKDELAEKTNRLKESQELELAWRKREREVEERAAGLDLEVSRKIAEQREPMEALIRTRILDEQRQEQAEKDRKIRDMEVQIDEMRNRLKQGSQQLQGDILEMKLEDVLSTNFPLDRIESVPTGIRGADIVQIVVDQVGKECGCIVWEVKNTKNWSDAWISKLKQDINEIKGDIGVIASFALPKDMQTIAFRDGVWVIEPNVAVAMATVLRSSLIQVAMARVAAQGTLRKSEEVHTYLTSPSFRRRVESIVDAFTAMKTDLDAEKRAVQKQWAKREKQIELTVSNTVGMYGDIQGIIGGSLPTISSLELDPSREDDDSMIGEAHRPTNPPQLGENLTP